MKIAIVGSGRVGKALGEKWNANGHQVVYGSRSSENHDQKITFSQKESVNRSDIVVLAVPGGAVPDLIPSLNLSNKVVIDATNSPTSGMNDYMPHAPLAKWVKAFNTIGFNIMENPNFMNTPADGFFCSDDENTTQIISQLIKDMGMNPVQVGNTTMAKDLENLAWLWIKMARTSGTRDFAFKLVKR